MNTLSYIVAADNTISAVLHSGSGYQVQPLFDLYRTSPDKEAFVHVLCTRLMLKSSRPSSKAMYISPAPTEPRHAHQTGTVLPFSTNQQHGG